MLGQLLVGLAILSGTLTSLALLGGMFMNLNFLLAGEPDPSAFYVVIQMLLLVSNAGAILGLDAWLSSRVHHPLVAAQAEHRPTHAPFGRCFFRLAGLLFLVVIVGALASARDFSPAGSVRDPSIVLAVLATVGAASALIGYLQSCAALEAASPSVEGRADGAGRTTL
jgi:hypothetical protein